MIVLKMKSLIDFENVLFLPFFCLSALVMGSENSFSLSSSSALCCELVVSVTFQAMYGKHTKCKQNQNLILKNSSIKLLLISNHLPILKRVSRLCKNCSSAFVFKTCGEKRNSFCIAVTHSCFSIFCSPTKAVSRLMSVLMKVRDSHVHLIVKKHAKRHFMIKSLNNNISTLY